MALAVCSFSGVEGLVKWEKSIICGNSQLGLLEIQDRGLALLG